MCIIVLLVKSVRQQHQDLVRQVRQITLPSDVHWSTGPCFTNSDTDCQLIKQSTPEILTTYYFNREKRWVRRNIAAQTVPVRRSELQPFQDSTDDHHRRLVPSKTRARGTGEGQCVGLSSVPGRMSEVQGLFPRQSHIRSVSPSTCSCRGCSRRSSPLHA